MRPEQLTELRRLLEAATPGPWEVHFHDDGRVWVQSQAEAGGSEAAPHWPHQIVADLPGDMETLDGEELSNADLCVALRNHADALLAAAEQAAAAEARVEALEAALSFYADPGNYAVTGYEERHGCPCAVEADQGKRGREALASGRKGDEGPTPSPPRRLGS